MLNPFDTRFKPSPFARKVRASVIFLVLNGHLLAFAATRDSFEGQEPSWQLVEKDCELVVGAHERSLQDSHSGQSSEHVRVRCNRGTKIYFANRIRPARVIDELVPSVWVKSDRKGIQLLARIVLPRTRDPHDDGPMTTLVSGTSYQAVGSWQRLTVDNLANQLFRREKLYLRSKFGAHVDLSEAYMDMIVLNVYTKPGETNVWIDDMSIEGHVTTARQRGGTGVQQATAIIDTNETTSRNERTRLRRSMLEVNGRPVLVRMVDHNGESFQQLRSFGFNAVWLRAPPTNWQLEEAERNGIWIVCPSPDLASQSPVDSTHGSILAWSLGHGLSQAELESTRDRATRIRNAKGTLAPKLVCNAASQLWNYSRMADILIFERLPIGSSFELTEFAPWLRDQSRLARAGTPFWATIQTEVALPIIEQASALVATEATTINVEPDQIRSLVYGAIAAGARGLYFRSRSRLDATDPATRLRAATLQFVNIELSVLEPWAAGGSYVGEMKTSDPEVGVSVLQTDRSRLLLATRRVALQQYVITTSSKPKVSFTDSNAVNSAKAYQYSASSGLHFVEHRRRPSGLGISLDGISPVAFVVLTQDPLVVDHLERRSGIHRNLAAQLQHEISSLSFHRVSETVRMASHQGQNETRFVALLQEAKSNLELCESVLKTGDFRAASKYSTDAMQSLAVIRQKIWEGVAGSFSSPSASPFCRGFDLLPLHWTLSAKMKNVRWSQNALPSGDFEDLNQMRQAGWRNLRGQDDSIRSAIELSAVAAKSGRTGVRIQALPVEKETAPAVVETSPVRISSPPIAVRRGQLVRIHGWIKLTHDIVGSRVGFEIYDSIGGHQLAERVRSACDWREVTLYRMAPRDGHFKVTFALAGFGEVWLDDVTVMIADLPEIANRPQRNDLKLQHGNSLVPR